MELTTFGLLFLIVNIIGLYRPVSYVFCVLIASSIFQASAVINIGDRGISPFLVAELFFIAKSFFTSPISISCNPSKYILHLLIFFCFSSIITIILPFVFEGVQVNSPSVASEDSFVPLKFSLKNLYYVFSIALHVLVFICLSNVSKYMKGVDIDNLMKIIVLIVSLVGFWEWLAKVSHTYLFPNDFFYCNKGYAQYWLQGNRLNSTFTEPSYAGAFLSSSLAYLVYTRSKVFLIIVNSLALILNLSGTGMVTFGISLLILFLTDSKLRKYSLLFVFVFFVFVNLINYKELMLEMLLNKSSSQSGVERTTTILYTLELIKKTYFMGVGLGAHRCLSFFTGLLASVGLIGLFLFCMFIYELLLPIAKTKNRNNKGVLVFGGTMFVAQCIAIPDLTTPFFWMWLFMAAYLVETIKNGILKLSLIKLYIWKKKLSVLMQDS